MNIFISKPSQISSSAIHLPASKSESNRALIIQALASYQSNTNIHLENLSAARDTQTLIRLLKSEDQILDVIDAGTTMRFLTAYLAITQQNKILTGTPRMCERPIHILVNALKDLGFEINYLGKTDFPPIEIVPSKNNIKHEIHILASVSSQYISALLMIAPLLPQGLRLILEGAVNSKPYIEMTLHQMAFFGIQCTWAENCIEILPQKYESKHYFVESDWSGASYWYSLVALSDDTTLELIGLKADSLQGDSVIQHLMLDFGVKTEFTEKGVLISKQSDFKFEKEKILIDFKDCPDLAQTIIALCSILHIKGEFTGLESLRIKETDRIAALQNEIQKFGVVLSEPKTGVWQLDFEEKIIDSTISIQTYDDHRMAMAFAPLALKYDLEIENTDVVRKSYPSFWDDLGKLGFGMRLL